MGEGTETDHSVQLLLMLTVREILGIKAHFLSSLLPGSGRFFIPQPRLSCLQATSHPQVPTTWTPSKHGAQ